ncbi:hypothetical protein CEV31_2659 [Brucella thiophenivorans]|uniref:Uncharacterized protein n=1 Tax=Brucella thiophenivorans TaxID=571255 RepID=A0A256FLW7_9HYPH|nr:hypothetical protein CEV31_2659 [Brucella thiophenivorans]
MVCHQPSLMSFAQGSNSSIQQYVCQPDTLPESTGILSES